MTLYNGVTPSTVFTVPTTPVFNGPIYTALIYPDDCGIYLLLMAMYKTIKYSYNLLVWIVMWYDGVKKKLQVEQTKVCGGRSSTSCTDHTTS